ncbi:DUF3592 domain-containing protein [Bifidobacterium avesanii]|uniref:DUF3592 domain-containing protein n=1 Tax=Bifidobacterium avesanii TaxID=1798157 RepID=A0A7K3TGN4_9BIFI|nr:DUF3592 domain-containing protein [Bifidobacterium avesanii]KAB8293608.1 hypothetical protein DSM100685_0676 [Bifidobacterium avesanii]NEG78255.1 DUF3592 domain-containing protein [Bifidobacterium avesanii]
MIEAVESTSTGSWHETPVLIVSLVMIAVSLVVFGVCLRLIRKTRDSRQRCTAETTGTVSELRERHDNDGTLWSPVFSYTVGGHNYELKSGIWSHPSKFHVGDKATVLYDPFEPSHAYMRKDHGRMIVLVSFAAASVVDFIAGVVMLALWMPR